MGKLKDFLILKNFIFILDIFQKSDIINIETRNFENQIVLF